MTVVSERAKQAHFLCNNIMQGRIQDSVKGGS